MDRGHAIVIGGSIAGLVAARVLARDFQQVTLLERDELPDDPSARRGVPQAHHVHAMLARGAMVLEELFPGLDAELAEAGAPELHIGEDVGYLGRFGWTAPFQPTIPFRAASRLLLEQRLRRRVRALERVSVLAGRDVARLLATAGGRRVTGVVCAGGGGEEKLEADLVVDASGRGSRAPTWLKELGRGAPPETVVDAYVGYATRIYDDLPPLAGGWRSVFVLWAPPVTRGGVVFPFEGGRAFVSLAGAARDYPPTDEAEFVAFARSLRAPHVHEAILEARPVSDIYATRSTANRWVHYERLADPPAGFVAVGDAVCAFNPVYGQGMTVAALGAELLGELVRREVPAQDFPRVFQRRLARRVRTVWGMATNEDFRFPTTSGQVPFTTRLGHRYLNALMRMGPSDPDVTRTLARVFQLLDSPLEILRPGIALRALARSVLG